MTPNRKPAFSIIELLVVVVILGLLTTLAVTSYTAAQRTARDNARKGQVQSLANAVETYYLANRSFPGSTAESSTCTGTDSYSRYYYYHPTDCGTSSGWIPGMERFMTPFVADKGYRGEDGTGSGAYADMLTGGSSRSYAYRNLVDSFAVYTRTESDDSGLTELERTMTINKVDGTDSVTGSSDIFLMQK